MDKCKTIKELKLEKAVTESFVDTFTMCKENPVLSESVRRSIAEQIVIPETAECSTTYTRKHREVKDGEVVLSSRRTFEAAARYKNKKIAVLNFANACCPSNPAIGLDFMQEKCLCRESTLNSCIDTSECWSKFYNHHREMYGYFGNPPAFERLIHSGNMIYTPGVTVFKTFDKVPRLMPQSKWFDVDVITMAAPDGGGYGKRNRDLMYEAFLDIFTKRFDHIMIEASAHNVDVLILGAFGCGEYGNDPAVVATAMARSIVSHRTEFDTIEVALYENRTKRNYRAFRLAFDSIPIRVE